MIHNEIPTTLKPQAGFSLLEVLTALLVLSVGLVGLGALLLTTLKNVHSSSEYSIASSVALDLEERLWFETARVSANNPDLLESGCLTETQINSVISTMLADWSQGVKEDGADWKWTTSGQFSLPVLSITPTHQLPFAVSHPGIFWKSIPITIEWRQDRFDDVLGDGVEQYVSEIRVPCRPVF